MENNIIHEITDFFLNPTVTNFAVAAVFSKTFYPIILNFVKNIIIPLFSALFFNINTTGLSFVFKGVNIFYGNLLADFIIFILSMLSVFFIFIKPFSNIIDKKTKKELIEKKEKELLLKQAISSIKNIEDHLINYNVNIIGA